MGAPEEGVLSTLGVLLVARTTHERAQVVSPSVHTRPVWEWIVSVSISRVFAVRCMCFDIVNAYGGVMRFGAKEKWLCLYSYTANSLPISIAKN